MRHSAILLIAAAGTVLGLRVAAQSPARPSNPPRANIARPGVEESRRPSAAPCPENLRTEEAEPLGPGPARLTTIRCLDLPRRQDYRLRPVVSPDGRSVASWQDDQDSPLDLVPFDGSPGFGLSNRVSFRDFGSGIDQRQEALAWRSDGSAVWSVEQLVVRPSGWALSGLTPILLDRSGKVRRFAPPEHPAGPLDALAWVGGDGLAVAQFGTRGGRYRPEHRDPSPTLAMIDVPRRRILDTLTKAGAEALRIRAGAYNGFGFFDVAAVQLRDGRLRALLQLQPTVDRSQPSKPAAGAAERRSLPAAWLVWTQGEKPVQLAPPIDDRFGRAEFTPDGSHILAWRPLEPPGGIIWECYDRCPPRRPPAPVEGVVAALVDSRSGRRVWSLEAKASEHWNRFGGPAISPTGRLALVPLPAVDSRQRIALLSMADGRILQLFSPSCTSCYLPSFGFIRGGRGMWIGTTSRLAFYDLK